MIYLASVYSLNATSQSESDKLTRQIRYNTVMKKTAELLKAGHKVFSPITHCHPMSVLYDMPATFDFWMELDCHYIAHCDEVWVLKMKGWQESNGITRELEFAIMNNIPIKYIKA